MGQLFTDLQAVRLDVEANAVIILDQTSLPGEKVYLSLSTKEAVWDAIHRLKVRGAPAIGITAAYGIYVCCKSLRARKFDDFYKGFVEIRDYFESSRPTAVNLSAALERMERCVLRNRELPVSRIKRQMLREALAIRDEDAASCHRIGVYALSLLRPGMGILTHCNAGALATAGHGTALGVFRSAVEAGKRISVFADETRPFLQGARLTAWEMVQENIPVTLITDNMSGHLMSRGEIDAVVVGTDRVAANGDVANKIGTYMVAVLANSLAGNAEITAPGADFTAFCSALNSVTVWLCRQIAGDGEGATRLLECCVTGAADHCTAKTVAKSIICSSLVKAAMFGADANWGRVLCAIGYSGAPVNVHKVDVAFRSAAGTVRVCVDGAGIPFSEEEAKKVLLEKEIEILVDLKSGDEGATAWGCDLTYDYVKINGDYRT